ncbi:uncharacterized protein LOC131927209 [Physella acuta]|uniref:uncharacterized protein LOC131927209 n=1 Tax=Physella acuta TaxID=109671 RepID=UPI0027DB0944|nr:uncharacterized protein LOC131927209 [Physella acuta]
MDVKINSSIQCEVKIARRLLSAPFLTAMDGARLLSVRGVFFFCSFLHSSWGVVNYCNLTISNTASQSGVEWDFTSLCIRTYLTHECQKFAQSFDRSLLPPEFSRSKLSVEPPGQFVLAGSNEFNFDIQWRLPNSASARAEIEGFLLIWTTNQTTDCRIFRLNESDSVRPIKTKFLYRLSLSPKKTYDLRLYSLPTPRPDERDVQGTYDQLSITTEKVVSSDEWSPNVSYKVNPNRTVSCWFLLSPPYLDVTEFEFRLFKANHSLTKNYRNFTRVFNISTTEETLGYVEFPNMTDDAYKIWVNCNCNKKKLCKKKCVATETYWFNISLADAELVPNFNYDQPEADDEDDTTFYIWGGVTGAVILIAAVIILGVVLKRYIDNHSPRDDPISHKTSGEVHASSDGTSEHTRTIAPALKRKRLYVMSADDHHLHMEKIKALVKFLEVHCHCDVTYPPNADVQETLTYEWFLRQLNQADHVIFVDSVAAEKLFSAHLSHTRYRGRPGGDLYPIYLQHILNHDQLREGLISVHFDVVRCRTYLPSPFVYKLPRQLPELLRKIHVLSSKSLDAVGTILPMKAENLQFLKEGSQLLSAIREARLFEANNRHWFHEKFGQPTKLLLPMTSDDSGVFPDIQTPLSVSTQELPVLVDSEDSQRYSRVGEVNNNTEELSVFTVPTHVTVNLKGKTAWDRGQPLRVQPEEVPESLYSEPSEEPSERLFIPPVQVSEISSEFSSVVRAINGFGDAEPDYVKLV